MSLRFSTQAQTDIRRMTRELSDLQAQVASGAKANDLSGFGGASGRLITAHGLKASTEARGSVITQLEARFGVQEVALGRVAGAAAQLAQSIREAVSANDGRGIGVELDLSFSAIVSGLNERWNGQPLFAGERQDGSPIKINTLDALVAATGPDDLFDEAARRQTIELDAGSPTTLAAKASELSQGLFDTLRDLKLLLDGAGGEIGQPISASEQSQLLAITARLETERNTFTNEEGRAGQLGARYAQEGVRLHERSDLLEKEIGDQADADLAQVSIRLSSLMAQYEAAAKTFADLSQLSLLRYL
jgi:flagellar hook-associated protein 3 FlgL